MHAWKILQTTDSVSLRQFTLSMDVQARKASLLVHGGEQMGFDRVENVILFGRCRGSSSFSQSANALEVPCRTVNLESSLLLLKESYQVMPGHCPPSGQSRSTRPIFRLSRQAVRVARTGSIMIAS